MLGTSIPEVSIEKKIEIFGHRGVGCSVIGGESTVPENSIAAFQKAVELGLDGVELDVWLTKDNQCVVIHGGGTDLEGFLYETVVDAEVRLANAEVYTQDHKFENASVSKIPIDGVFDFTSPLSVEIGGVRRLRRIEEIHYSELRKSGHLRLRQPWSKYKQNYDQPDNASDTTSTWCGSERSALSSVSGSNVIAPILDKNVSSGSLNLGSRSTSSGASSEEDSSVALLQTPIHLHVTSHEVAQNIQPAIAVVQPMRSLTKMHLEDVRLDYIREMLPYIDSNSVISDVPLLSEVFAQFYGKLRFNVELKGTNPLLGNAVLKIAKPFPGIIARISSFLWTTEDCDISETQVDNYVSFVSEDEQKNSKITGLDKPFQLMASITSSLSEPSTSGNSTFSTIISDNHKYPNGPVPNDLLYPILHNSSNIPLALLFAGYEIPSIPHILKCLKRYDAEWIHLPQAFCIQDEEAQKALRALEDEFLKKRNVRELLRTFKLQQDINVSDKNGEHEENYSREKILTEMLNLFYLVKELHSHRHKILIYGGRTNENVAIMELCLICDVDGLCPNDVTTSLLLSKKYNLRE